MLARQLDRHGSDFGSDIVAVEVVEYRSARALALKQREAFGGCRGRDWQEMSVIGGREEKIKRETGLFGRSLPAISSILSLFGINLTYFLSPISTAEFTPPLSAIKAVQE